MPATALILYIRGASRADPRRPGVGLVPRPQALHMPAAANGGEGKGSRVSQDDNNDTHVDPEPQITTASILIR
jgi:hypothetical protein